MADAADTASHDLAAADDPLPALPPIRCPRMPAAHDLQPHIRARICRSLLLRWPVKAISEDLGISVQSVYNIQSNMLRYGSVSKPHYRILGRSRKLSAADEDAVFAWLLQEGWRCQDEIISWLWMERGIIVSQPTISRMLWRRRWNRKMLRRIALQRSESLRQAYLDDIRQFAANDLIFLDESIFNEKSGWRHHAYAPVGQNARYNADIRRGRTWSICAAMSLNGWLPCTGIKEGYWSAEYFYEWLQTRLLPTIQQQHPGRPMVIVMDNVSIHCGEEITQLIEHEGHIVRFLPPYSPDYNPIELTFSVLKAWMKRNWIFLRQTCTSYGEFLELAIQESRCDRFARRQFKHAANGVYIEQAEFDRFRKWLYSLIVAFGNESTTTIQLIQCHCSRILPLALDAPGLFKSS